ncbi:MAG: TolC family protein [Dysgonamonadaceae bacterium]|jgi:outer membrane protein TolC|nr:TolC family protein [Dysgonamonadaceae bacterium]MDD3901256.1 TolC family protein [Dysgonamonadaceae bacterium]MDD4399794.1 TolC family protein [Dysgonamonadaceae bacterium]
MKKLLLAISFVFIYSFLLQSQSTYTLTLEESIEIAKKKSYSMLRLNEDLKIAEFNLKSATSRLKTHIDMTIGAPQYNETIESWNDTTGITYYYPVKDLGYSGVMTINQPLPTDGNIFISNMLSSSDNLKSNFRSSRLRSRIGFNQPLHSFYAYNSIKSTLKRAELDFERSNKQYKREELNLIYQVSSSYYNLLSLQKSTEIASLDLERQMDAYEISKNKYAAGLIREVDALQMEVDLAEAQNNHDISVLNEVSAKNAFIELLGLSLDDSVILSNEMNYQVVIIDPEQAVDLALKNRLEVREQEIQIELQKLSIKQQRANGLIRGSVDAYFERAGMDHQANISFMQSIKNSYNNLTERNSSYGIGLSVTIPILDWGENRALVRAAESRLKQYNYRKEEVEREIETEVKNLIASINSNLKRLQVLEKNVLVAEKSFEITRQRFSDGDIDSQSLALERNRLNNAYTSHLRAYINYQLSLADLMRKTFYDFQNQREIK